MLDSAYRSSDPKSQVGPIREVDWADDLFTARQRMAGGVLSDGGGMGLYHGMVGFARCETKTIRKG